jgi:antitoxin component YwqK of YwqJK toxin-antitoxin module
MKFIKTCILLIIFLVSITFTVIANNKENVFKDFSVDVFLDVWYTDRKVNFLNTLTQKQEMEFLNIIMSYGIEFFDEPDVYFCAYSDGSFELYNEDAIINKGSWKYENNKIIIKPEKEKEIPKNKKEFLSDTEVITDFKIEMGDQKEGSYYIDLIEEANNNHHASVYYFETLNRLDLTEKEISDKEKQKYKGTKGIYKEYFWNNKMRKEVKYNNSERNGLYKEYFDNGTLKIKANYIQGKLEGKFLEYYINGKKKTESMYQNGILEGRYRTYYLSGVLRYDMTYKNGLREGISKKYNQNGHLRSIYTFKANEPIKKQYFEK